MPYTSMIFWVLILLTCAVSVGCSITIELYSGQNYHGLQKKIIVNKSDEKNCFQLDQTYEVRSLKTEQCVIVYETKDCKRIGTKLPEGSKLYSIRVERNTALFDIDGAYNNRKEERGVQSFHLCTKPGAGLLNVDIYSDPSYTGDLVASYKGVCKCRNIPRYIVLKEKPFSIDNHGTNMYFYDKEDCTGQQRLIPAGDNERSRNVFRLDDARAVVIRSFRLADSLDCPKLDALIYKFNTSIGKETHFRNLVKQNTTYTLTNREHNTVTEDINLNESNTAEYCVAESFTYIHTTRVKAEFFMISNDFITAPLGSTLKSSIEAHYQYPDTNQNTPTIVTLPWNAYSPMPVDLPPCTACTVNVSLNKFQGYPVSYTAEAIVTGVVGDDKLTAEQIRQFLPPGMEYVENNDDYSVVVTVEGEMEGSRDRSSTEVSCTPLSDC